MRSSMRGVFGLTLGLCLSGLTAAEPATVEGPPIERVRADLVKVRAMLTNAKVKFRNGVVGGISENSPVLAGPPTPGKACCAGNIVRLYKLFKQVDAALSELGRCYEAAGDLGGIDQLDLVRRDLEQLKKGVQLFQTVKNPQQTHQALGGTQRAYLLLTESQKDLPGCNLAAQ